MKDSSENSRQQDRKGTKKLHAKIPAPVLNYSTTNGRSHEGPDALENVQHAQPRAEERKVVHERGQHDGAERHDAAGEEAVEHGEGDAAGDVGHAGPVEDADGGQEHGGRVRVEDADVPGQGRGHEPAEDGRAVEDGEEVSRDGQAGAAVARGVALEVEKRLEVAEVVEEDGDHVDDEVGVRELRALEQVAEGALLGAPGVPRARDGDGEEAEGEGEEPLHARGPGEPDGGLEGLEEDGVQGRRETAAEGGQAHDEGPPARLEVRRHDGHGGDREEARAHADEDPVGQEHGPVRRADARQHEAQGDEDRPHGQERAAVPGVV